MSKSIQILCFLLIILLLCCVESPHAQEQKSRYVTLSYPNREVLLAFNDNLRLNRKLNSALRKNVVTMADEALAKIDIIIEKVQIVLEMFPDYYHVNVVLLPDDDDVARMYKSKYGKRVDHIAYYSLSEKTIYISVDDTRLKVVAHEIGHSVVDHYFKVRPPYTIHELMAQFAEKHVTD